MTSGNDGTGNDPAEDRRGRHALPGDGDEIGDSATMDRSGAGHGPGSYGRTVHSDAWTPPERLGKPVGGEPEHAAPTVGGPSPEKSAPLTPTAAEATVVGAAARAESSGRAGGGATATLARPEHSKRVTRSREVSEGKKQERRLAYWLIAPAVILMLVVTAYPIVYAFWLSLNKSSLSAPGEREFTWFSNYGTVLSSNYWWTALLVTIGITVVSVVIELVLGMAIAIVMHRTIFGRGVIRTVVLIPYGIVTVAAAFSWYYAWTPGTGYLANLLPDGSAPLTQQWPSLAIIVLAEVWKTTPFMALLLLAGLALVPDELLKAAEVDGAGAWTRLRRIIIPMMKPAILVALLFRTLDAFRIFDNIYVLTAGNNNTYSVSMLGYDNLFKAFNLGVGSAISILIFVCVAIIAFIFIKGFGTAAPGSDNEGR
ncbi:carbohydrate ABC transporter permease [Gordonia aichiensis]|uniref:Putative ABC transporter permease protein n=1 Tax=Gordonia aichiensis NBRC 108223 TaxID=1220583 RepID=L7KJ79_9ACTN|nr:sugar ABC transporter permease [Gordonia aichiensis]GAC48541.1 putative ABC transporter permease protein [Gordonia aichiensis NBRC 108223]